jgi:hypothetical protein
LYGQGGTSTNVSANRFTNVVSDSLNLCPKGRLVQPPNYGSFADVQEGGNLMNALPGGQVFDHLLINFEASWCHDYS